MVENIRSRTMRVITKSPGAVLLVALLAGSMPARLAAQPQDQQGAPITGTVTDTSAPEAAEMTKGPEIRGIISARNGDRIQITTADGANTVVAVNDATRITASGGFLGLNRSKLGPESLLNGLP